MFFIIFILKKKQNTKIIIFNKFNNLNIKKNPKEKKDII